MLHHDLLKACVAVFVLAACGHHGGDPTTTPIEPVTQSAVIVVNGGDASLSVIDLATSEVVGTIAIADAAFPHHLYLDAAGATMYLAIPGGDLSGGHAGGHGDHAYVLRLDAATGELLAAAGFDAGNHNVIPAPGGATVWTSQATEPGAVLVLDAETLEVETETAVGALPAEITFAPDGSHGFVANSGSDDVTVLDPTSAAAVATIPVGDNPVGAWPGADGLLYVDNEVGKSLSVIDPATLAVTTTIDLGFTPAFAATRGDELWVTDTDAGRLVFFDRVTGEPTGELATGAGAHAIAFDAAATRAWVTNQAADTVSVIDAAAHEVIATVPVGRAPNGLAVREL